MNCKAKALKKEKGEYEMPKHKALKEHVRLIKILKKDDKRGIKSEIKEQGRDLKEIKKS